VGGEGREWVTTPNRLTRRVQREAVGGERAIVVGADIPWRKEFVRTIRPSAIHQSGWLGDVRGT
jgi:hypothetical protein